MQSVHEAVRDILKQAPLGTQEELRDALAEKGYEGTQSTVSRALKRIGAVRSYDEKNQPYYVLPSEDALPNVNSTITQLVQSVTSNESTVVVITKPGSASLIARHIDHRLPSVLGTVAGDDCILVIPESTKKTEAVMNEVKDNLGLEV